MDKNSALTAFAALSQETRLDVLRLLIRSGEDGMAAGEIGAALDVRQNTMSTNLSILAQSGLIRNERQGRSIRYFADVDGLRGLLTYLMDDCCGGRPELCAPLFSQTKSGKHPMTRPKYNVLFICTGNSARSIFAESILRRDAGDRFTAWSAGTKPRSELNPFALEILEQKGHDISVLRAKNVGEFQAEDAPKFDFVFTVCDRAAEEECPAWSGQPVSAHWGMPDPVKAEGTDAQKALAFQQTYGALQNRIKAFTALPIEALDRISLQKAVDEIGHENAGVSA